MSFELWLWTGYVYVIGLFLGSFYNVVGIRVPKNETLLGRSKCPTCNHTLGAFELLPIIGYVLIGGKCKSCGNKISVKYPIIEILTALLLAFSFVVLYGNMLEYMVVVLLISLLIIVSVSDMYYQIVPDIVLIVFGIMIFTLRVIGDLTLLVNGLLGSLLAFVFLVLISVYGKKRFGKEALGGGDIKLYLIIGLVLGYQTVLLSLTLAAIIGLLYYFIFPKQKEYIPFVPFISAGSIIVYFYGTLFIDWYLNILY